MLRVVFDSNVYISALLYPGTPRDILALALRKQLVLLVSEAIIEETAGKLHDKFSWPEHRIKAFVKSVTQTAEVFNPKKRLQVIKDDPDNRVLECAVEGGADLVISGDRHLLRLKAYQNIPIQNPKYLTYLFKS